MFLFSCFTGLAFIDAKELKRTEIIKDNNGKMWIRKGRHNMKKEKARCISNVPLITPAIEILEKYEDHPTCILETVRPSNWSKVKPQLKKDKIIFPDIVTWDSFHYECYKDYRFSYETDRKVSRFCEGIAFGADDVLCGSIEMIIGLDTRNVDISRWYDLTTTNAVSLKFYGNTRIDVKFKDSAAAESCFKRLRLNEIKLRDEN